MKVKKKQESNSKKHQIKIDVIKQEMKSKYTK